MIQIAGMVGDALLGLGVGLILAGGSHFHTGVALALLGGWLDLRSVLAPSTIRRP